MILGKRYVANNGAMLLPRPVAKRTKIITAMATPATEIPVATRSIINPTQLDYAWGIASPGRDQRVQGARSACVDKSQGKTAKMPPDHLTGWHLNLGFLGTECDGVWLKRPSRFLGSRPICPRTDGHPALIWADQQRQVLGHVARLNGFDTDALKGLSELYQLRRIVELAAIGQTAGPRKMLAIGFVEVSLPCSCKR